MDEQLGKDQPKEVGAKPKDSRQRVQEKADEIQKKAATNRGRKPLTPEQMAAKDTRLEVQVARLNSKVIESYKVDLKRVKQIARESKYGNGFYGRLDQLERAAERGSLPKDPYEYLQTGKQHKGIQVEVGESQVPKYQAPAMTHYATARNVWAGFERSVANLSQALIPITKTKKVRSEAAQRRDYEREL